MITKEQINEQIEKEHIFEKECNKVINRLSIIRLITFVFSMTLLITCIIDFSLILLTITIIFVCLFIFLINLHDKKFRQLAFHQNKIKVLHEYNARHSYDWHKFNEKGDNLGIKLPNSSLDVDIVGEQSLFQFLNVCKTIGGKKKLVSLLTKGRKNIQEMKESIECIKDYSLFWNENIEFQAYLKEFDKKIYRIRKNAIAFPQNIKRRFISLYVGLFITLGIFISIILSLLKVINPSVIFVLMLLQLSLSFIGKDKELLNSIDQSTLYYHSLKDTYVHLSKISFSNEINIKNKEKIKKGILSINRLGKIYQLASIYHNGISNLFINLFVPFNEILLKKYLDFSIDNPSILEDSVESLEHFETLASLANIYFTKSNICIPEISNEFELNFLNLKHPLLMEETCISNSFSKKENINIITGSNMSGKTSFLRTIAINLVLMRAGTYVLASNFKSSNYEIFTSMRVKDDIQNGISTFYAELLRIKEALDYSSKNQPMILLVDEIFKGTNMNDRILGAKSVMKKLDLKHVVLFITTHDFDLCDYQEVELANYHFSEYYDNNKIRFDYLIKEGKCETTNAVYLMKNTGIMD